MVKVYNINKGHNADMATRSPVLSGYEEFIAEIKKNLKSMELREAIKLAVKACISKNILVSFLERHSSEVENMFSQTNPPSNCIAEFFLSEPRLPEH